MTDGNPSRLRVVGGMDTEPEPEAKPTKAKKPRKRTVPMKDQLQRWHCAPCSEEMGYEQHQMVQVLRDPYEANGKLVGGGLWWACARCMKPQYLIRLFGQKR
jgi:hypothetical protein